MLGGGDDGGDEAGNSPSMAAKGASGKAKGLFFVFFRPLVRKCTKSPNIIDISVVHLFYSPKMKLSLAD